ncbi:unnamed protein product [Prorocentrum cordatum]|uniref:Uncharacterized protein n=1 Tax=Prorocentrum cordatum TaxID=2364126 RepID=A0ABN9PS39_9DINO|nr:unnamed protein product [Polarella glacialis]
MAPKAEPKAEAKAKAKAKPKAKAEPKDEEEHIPKPDREAMEKKMEDITKAIDDLKAKKDKLSEKIKSGSGVKDEFFRQKSEISAKIAGFKEKIDALHAQKDELQKGVAEKKGEKTQMVQDMKKMKASIGYKTEEEMDNRMRQIEYRLQTETIPLKEEKDLLKEIQELKRNRPKVAQVNKMEEGLNSFDAGGGVKETLSTINEQIRNWMQEKAKVLEERKKLEEEYDGKVGDNSLYEERNKLNEKIREKQEERNKVRDAFREEERKFREMLNKKKQEQQERYAAEREARQKEWEDRNRQKKVEKLDEQPFVTEITLIEQTIKFCKSLTGGKEVEKEEEKKDVEHKNMDGLQVLNKKDERDEFWFEPTKAKKSKGSSKPKAKESSKPIKHNAVTFKLFDQLKLDAPITLDDIPPTVEKLEAMLVKYEAKVADWEKNKEERKAKILAGEDVEDEKEDKAEPKKEEKEEKEEEEKADEKEE